MKRPISTATHGAFDYLTAAGYVALPRVLGWTTRPTRLLDGAALFTLGLSIMTHYELGLARLVPMRMHLALDGLLDGVLAAAGLRLRSEESMVRATLLLLALAGAAVSALSEPESPPTLQGDPLIGASGEPV